MQGVPDARASLMASPHVSPGPARREAEYVRHSIHYGHLLLILEAEESARQGRLPICVASPVLQGQTQR